MRSVLTELEQVLERPLLLLACNNLEVNLIEAVHDALAPLGRRDSLAVLLFCHGGYVAAARRIAMILRDFAGHITFLVPSRCDSAGTILALSGDDILYTPLSIFSPVDPSLSGGTDESGGQAISVQDIRLLPQAIHDWFGLDLPTARERAFDLVAGTIFPASLTAFHRSARETADICRELLAMRTAPDTPEIRDAIAQTLTYGFGSHSYPIAGADLHAMGLPARRRPELDQLARLAGRSIGGALGPSVSPSEDSWVDTLVGTREAIRARHRAAASHPRLTWGDYSP